MKTFIRSVIFVLFVFAFGQAAYGQATATAVARGSQTAKDGFRNENVIRDKFNNWRNDGDAKAWLSAMGYDQAALANVTATKPNGEKADVVIRVSTVDGTTLSHGISIKLVSSQNGFNQIDKRWLRQYAQMWEMPQDVVSALRLYVGEDPPIAKSRRPERMFLTELTEPARNAVVEFFTKNKMRIISDLLKGEGNGRADWLMVAWKTGGENRWKIVSVNDAIDHFSDGPVEVTRAGNLKLGRITVQRKGGDGGRETAKMLQFKMNPAQIFELGTKLKK